MATYNKEDNIKWNDLSTSLQDIIMRKITWDMLHPDLQAWLLDKERRIIELERWRRTKADPMLDDHERRIGNCESQITSIWSKLGDAEDKIENVANNAAGGGELFDVGFTHYVDSNGIWRVFMGAKGNITGSGTVQITNSIRFDFHHIDRGQFIITPMGPITQIMSTPSDNYSINGDTVVGDFRNVGYIHPTNPALNPLGLTSPVIDHYIMMMWKYEGPTGGNSLAFSNDTGRISISNYDPVNKRYPQDFKASDLDDGTVQFSEAFLAPYFMKV